MPGATFLPPSRLDTSSAESPGGKIQFSSNDWPNAINTFGECNTASQFRMSADALSDYLMAGLDGIEAGVPTVIDRNSAVFTELITKSAGAEYILLNAGFFFSPENQAFVLPGDADAHPLRWTLAGIRNDPTMTTQLREQRRGHALRMERLKSVKAQQEARQKGAKDNKPVEPPATDNGVALKLLENDNHRLQVCLRTLQMILTNVLTHPDQPRYRRIKKDNPKLQSDIVTATGGIDFLKSVGFAESGDRIQLPMTTPLFILRSGLDALKSITDLRWAQEEHILADQREEIALSVAYELMYEMGDIDYPPPYSNRESRMRHHLGWRAIKADEDEPEEVQTMEELQMVMANDGDEPLTVEQRMDLRRKKLEMLNRYKEIA